MSNSTLYCHIRKCWGKLLGLKANYDHFWSTPFQYRLTQTEHTGRNGQNMSSAIFIYAINFWQIFFFLNFEICIFYETKFSGFKIAEETFFEICPSVPKSDKIMSEPKIDRRKFFVKCRGALQKMSMTSFSNAVQNFCWSLCYINSLE